MIPLMNQASPPAHTPPILPFVPTSSSMNTTELHTLNGLISNVRQQGIREQPENQSTPNKRHRARRHYVQPKPVTAGVKKDHEETTFRAYIHVESMWINGVALRVSWDDTGKRNEITGKFFDLSAQLSKSYSLQYDIKVPKTATNVKIHLLRKFFLNSNKWFLTTTDLGNASRIKKSSFFTSEACWFSRDTVLRSKFME